MNWSAVNVARILHFIRLLIYMTNSQQNKAIFTHVLDNMFNFDNPLLILHGHDAIYDR